VGSFADITSNPDLQNALAAEYGDVNNIDLWVGALAEDHLPGASIGPLLTTVFQDQFTRLRDGDWFYFEHDPAFTPFEVDLLKQTTLAGVIRANSGISNIQSNVFFVSGQTSDGGVTSSLASAVALAAPNAALVTAPPNGVGSNIMSTVGLATTDLSAGAATQPPAATELATASTPSSSYQAANPQAVDAALGSSDLLIGLLDPALATGLA
jgi:hypothetical protein